MAWGLAHISSRELAEWAAYAGIEPIGEARADIQAGVIASTVANTRRDPEKKRDPFTPAEFTPDFWEPQTKQHKQTPEQMLALMKAHLQ